MDTNCWPLFFLVIDRGSIFEFKQNNNLLLSQHKLIDTFSASATKGLSGRDRSTIFPVADAIITGVYGSQRILNGKPRWPHYGLDFAKDEGTPIKAMISGTVTLVEPDLYYTGGTLIFDHGHGISTLYMHMKTLMVKKGQKVKQGDVVGTVGSTGRSTGAHLDVRLNWFQTRLDPATVLDIKN